jgi:hypothetical protein
VTLSVMMTILIVVMMSIVFIMETEMVLIGMLDIVMSTMMRSSKMAVVMPTMTMVIMAIRR